jgi:hypothetical protein
MSSNKDKIEMVATLCCPLTMSLYYCYKSYNNTKIIKKEIIEKDYIINWFYNESGKNIKHQKIQRF